MSIGELISLRLRCSPLESARETLSKHLALLNAKKSPATDGPPTVCMIVENPVWGGTERHTQNLIDALVARGFRIKLVTGPTHQASHAALAALETTSLQWIPVRHSIHDPVDCRVWLRTLREIKSYVVILPCPRVAWGSFGFLRALRRCFSKVIYIEHCTPDAMPDGRGKPNRGDLRTARGRTDWIERLRRTYRVRCADHIVTVSDDARRRLIDGWQPAAQRVTTIHNAVDAEKWRVERADRDRARESAGIASDTFVFGMVTRLSPEKGVDTAIRAFAAFRETESNRDVILIIAGEGPIEADLRDLAKAVGVADRVVWRGFEKDPSAVYRMMDAILLPSREEGMPLALLEAMAGGVIPIAYGVGGIPEVIRDDSLGWSVKPGEFEGFLSAMRAVVELSQEQRAVYRQRFRSLVATHFDADTAFDRLIKTTGLDTDATRHSHFLMSKAVRDPCDAWIDFVTLWWYAHRPAETPTRHRAPVEIDIHKVGKPNLCILEHSQGWGGAENHTYQLIEYLQANGFPLEYVCGNESITTPPAGIDVLRAPINLFDDAPDTEATWLTIFAPLKSRVLLVPALDVGFGRSLAFMKAVRKSFDRIIYIEHTLPPAMPTRTRKRYLCGLVPGLSVWWHRERLRRKLRMRCPTRIIAVSEAVRQSFIEQWNCPPEKIVTIRNGVDCARFSVTRGQRIEARRVYDLPVDALVFGIVARLSEEKGVDLAVRAFAAFRAAQPACDAYLLVAGDGPDAAMLRALGEQLEVADRVRWLGYQTDTPRVFALMDVVLASSRIEGLPLALLEGMAAGVIPIVFRVGGMPEVISDPSLGWVVEAGDVSGFAGAMREVANLTSEQRDAFRDRVTQYVHEQFNLQAANGRIAELIEKEYATIGESA